MPLELIHSGAEFIRMLLPTNRRNTMLRVREPNSAHPR